MSKTVHAKDYQCIVCEKQKAEYFWPNVDPDIPSYAYCKPCLDEAKMRVLKELEKFNRMAHAEDVWRTTLGK